MTDAKDEERARAFWRWFRETPLAECRDADCDRKLTAAFAEVRREERALRGDPKHAYSAELSQSLHGPTTVRIFVGGLLRHACSHPSTTTEPNAVVTGPLVTSVDDDDEATDSSPCPKCNAPMGEHIVHLGLPGAECPGPPPHTPEASAAPALCTACGCNSFRSNERAALKDGEVQAYWTCLRCDVEAPPERERGWPPGCAEHVALWDAVHGYGRIVYAEGRPTSVRAQQQVAVVEAALRALMHRCTPATPEASAAQAPWRTSCTEDDPCPCCKWDRTKASGPSSCPATPEPAAERDAELSALRRVAEEARDVVSRARYVYSTRSSDEARHPGRLLVDRNAMKDLGDALLRVTERKEAALRDALAALDAAKGREVTTDPMIHAVDIIARLTAERDEVRAELARQSAARVAVDAAEGAEVARLREALLILADGPHHEECDVDRDVPRCVCVVGVAERLLATGAKGGA